MRRIRDGYMNIDCLSNAIDNLKKAEQFLLNTDDPFRWKWASIALSSALYGFMIHALGDTNYHEVLDFSRMHKRDKRLLQTVSQYSGPGAILAAEAIKNKAKSEGKAKLIRFNIALQRIQDARYMERFVDSGRILLSDAERKNVLKLRGVLRNSFEHLQPGSWSIEELYFIEPMRDTVNAMERLLKSGMIWPPRPKGTAGCIKRIKQILKKEEKKFSVSAAKRNASSARSI